MAGKSYLEIKVCKYSVTGESFCSSLKQNLQRVYYELNLQTSEDCPLVFLMGMRSNFRVYIIHESVMQDCFLVWMIHLSRRRHIHNSIQRVLHKTDKHNWISELNVCDSFTS